MWSRVSVFAIDLKKEILTILEASRLYFLSIIIILYEWLWFGEIFRKKKEKKDLGSQNMIRYFLPTTFNYCYGSR